MFGASVLISAEGKGNVEVVAMIHNRCTRDLILNATFSSQERLMSSAFLNAVARGV